MKRRLEHVSVGSWRYALCCLIGIFTVWVLMVSTLPAGAAVACSSLTSGQSTTDGTTFTTASVSPAANSLVLLFVSAGGTTNPTTVPTGGGITTWTTVQDFSWHSDNQKRFMLFRALEASPGSGAITLTYGATAAGVQWSVVQCTGVPTSGTNGSGAVAQSQAFGGTSTTGSIPYSPALTSGSVTVQGFAHNANELATAEAGLTELSDTSQGNPNLGLEVSAGVSSSTPDTSSGSWATNVQWGGLGVEVLEDTGGGTTTTTAVTTTTTAPTTTTVPPTTTTSAVPNGTVIVDTERSEGVGMFMACIAFAAGCISGGAVIRR